MRTYYNEFDKNAAAWLRDLMRAGLIPDGEVDVRSIVEVRADDLRGYDTCHFFAGIGGWPYALDLAGWSGPAWTGSCPCQPFSAAGKRKGAADERHLWPEFRRLIAECRPSVVFGEQVASKDGRVWLAGVRADLEALGYGVGAADLCAAGVGAPHIRQRLWWVANSQHTGQSQQSNHRAVQGPPSPQPGHAEGADADAFRFGRSLAVGGVADAEHTERGPISLDRGDGCDGAHEGWSQTYGELGARGQILCLDGKARRFEPGAFPLAHGVPARVGRLRGYGNAIVPQVAAEFVKAYMA